MIKKYKNGEIPIILAVDKNRQLISGNPNIKLDVATSLSGLNIEYTFMVDSNQTYFIVYFKDIVSKITSGQNVSSVTRNISDSQPDYINPPTGSTPAYIFFPGYSTITSFSIIWTDSYGTLSNMIFKEPHPELLTVSAVRNIRSLHAGISPNQNAAYLPKLSMFSGTYTSALKNLPSLTRLFVNLTFDTAISDDFRSNTNFPKLRQLSGLITGLDLKDFWNGNPNRMSVNMGNYTGTSVTYTGGAIFPAVISDADGFSIDYIYNQEVNTATKLTGTAFSKFIVDMANKVTSVTSAHKRIRAIGSSPDPSYTDNSKPYYKTYNTALAHLNSLGINISFTS